MPCIVCAICIMRTFVHTKDMVVGGLSNGQCFSANRQTSYFCYFYPAPGFDENLRVVWCRGMYHTGTVSHADAALKEDTGTSRC